MASSANGKANPEHPHNHTMLQAFEWCTPSGGHHWNWLRDNAPRLADIGITAVWIPPPTKAASTDSSGYDIYDLWDLGEFARTAEDETRTKYGTLAELKGAIKTLREHKISVYIDAVLNHKAGADETQTFKGQMVDQDDRTKDVGEPEDIDGWTRFTFPGRKGKYSDFTWGFEHFTGVDWDQKQERSAIWRIIGDNKGWAKDTDRENGNFDYLMCADIDHSHPDVAKDILDWGAWIVRELGVQGFRFDAVKHMSRAFVCEFVKRVREEARKMRKEQGKEPQDESTGPVMFAVGEFWKDSVQSCLKYLGEFGDEQFSLFDAPLHYNFKEAGDAGAGYDLRKIWDGSIVQARPIDAVTLVENHDTQPGQSLESTVSPQFKPLAYSLILLRQDGYPCVFLGDLDGCHAEGDSQPAVPPMSNLGAFVRARKLFAYGEQRDYWDHASCVGWVRTGAAAAEGDETPGAGHDGCAVVLCVGDEEGKKWMEVGKEHAGKKWSDVLGWAQGEVEINEDGWAEFYCPAHSCAIWAAADAKGREEFK